MLCALVRQCAAVLPQVVVRGGESLLNTLERYAATCCPDLIILASQAITAGNFAAAPAGGSGAAGAAGGGVNVGAAVTSVTLNLLRRGSLTAPALIVTSNSRLCWGGTGTNGGGGPGRPGTAPAAGPNGRTLSSAAAMAAVLAGGDGLLPGVAGSMRAVVMTEGIGRGMLRWMCERLLTFGRGDGLVLLSVKNAANAAAVQQEAARLGLARGMMSSFNALAASLGARVDRQLALQGDLVPSIVKVGGADGGGGATCTGRGAWACACVCVCVCAHNSALQWRCAAAQAALLYSHRASCC